MKYGRRTGTTLQRPDDAVGGAVGTDARSRAWVCEAGGRLAGWGATEPCVCNGISFEDIAHPAIVDGLVEVSGHRPRAVRERIRQLLIEIRIVRGVVFTEVIAIPDIDVSIFAGTHNQVTDLAT